MVLANHAERNAAEDITKVDALMVMGNDFDIPAERYIGRYAEGDLRRAVHSATKSASQDTAASARLAYEEQLLTLARAQSIPTLTVCGATQLASVMQGGGLLQHIPDQIGDNHHQQNTLNVPGVCPVVPVSIHGNTALGTIAGGAAQLYTASYPPAGDISGTVNSFHHQAIDPDMLGTGFRIAAESDRYTNVRGETRRLVEAIEPDPNGPLASWPMIGVQWHPEFGDSAISASIIADTVAKGAAHAQQSNRDARHDYTAAMVANLRSSKKSDAPFVETLTRQLANSAGMQLN